MVLNVHVMGSAILQRHSATLIRISHPTGGQLSFNEKGQRFIEGL